MKAVSYRTALALMVLVGAPCTAWSEAPGPAPRGSYGVLAYVQDSLLYIRELPSGQAKQVTTEGIAETPKWSPTGAWLLFEQRPADPKRDQCRTVLVRRDGSGLRGLGAVRQAAWVGRSDELAYEKGHAIVLAHAPEFAPQVLAAMPIEHRNDAVGFTVSRDKRWIAFTRRWANWNREGTEYTQASGALWVQRVDGSNRRMLYDAKRREEDLPVLAGWSPDSRYVFMGTHVYMAGSGNLDGTPLYAFDIRTGKRRSLAPNGVMKMGDWYAYSPDGSRIVVGDGGNRWGDDPKVLLIVNAKTWRGRRITADATDSFFPAWSPDGKRFAFVENSQFRAKGKADPHAFQGNQPCVMSADGSHKRRLHRAGGNGIWYPMW